MPPEPPVGPLPVSAAFKDSTGLLVVTFDQPLQVGVIDVANWAMTADVGFGPAAFIPDPGGPINGITATIHLTEDAPGAGLDRCSYAAAPANVIGLVSGLPAPSFADFPVVVTL